jgi:hypothetical protein
LFGEDAFGIRLTVHLIKRQVVELHQFANMRAILHVGHPGRLRQCVVVEGRLNGQSGIGTEAWAANRDQLGAQSRSGSEPTWWGMSTLCGEGLLVSCLA